MRSYKCLPIPGLGVCSILRYLLKDLISGEKIQLSLFGILTIPKIEKGLAIKNSKKSNGKS